jgi:hypothetical protein
MSDSIKYRYPGPQPFSAEQEKIFFGREQDVEQLFDLVLYESTVVLYSKSGLGKSDVPPKKRTAEIS